MLKKSVSFLLGVIMVFSFIGVYADEFADNAERYDLNKSSVIVPSNQRAAIIEGDGNITKNTIKIESGEHYITLRNFLAYAAEGGTFLDIAPNSVVYLYSENVAVGNPEQFWEIAINVRENSQLIIVGGDFHSIAETSLFIGENATVIVENCNTYNFEGRNEKPTISGNEFILKNGKIIAFSDAAKFTKPTIKLDKIELLGGSLSGAGAEWGEYSILSIVESPNVIIKGGNHRLTAIGDTKFTNGSVPVYERIFYAILEPKNGDIKNVVFNRDYDYNFKSQWSEAYMPDWNDMDISVARFYLPQDVKIVSINGKSDLSKQNFTDVEWHNWFYPYAWYCNENNLIQGVGNNQFSPDATMTRAMFVTTLGRMLGENFVNTQTPFADVAESDYFAKYVAWAVEKGVVQGYGDGNFYPHKEITREEMAVIIDNFLTKSGVNFTPPREVIPQLLFNDREDISLWAHDSTLKITQYKIMNGEGNLSEGNSMFFPHRTTTRAEAATVLMRIYANLKTEK